MTHWLYVLVLLLYTSMLWRQAWVKRISQRYFPFLQESVHISDFKISPSLKYVVLMGHSERVSLSPPVTVGMLWSQCCISVAVPCWLPIVQCLHSFCCTYHCGCNFASCEFCNIIWVCVWLYIFRNTDTPNLLSISSLTLPQSEFITVICSVLLLSVICLTL